MRRLSHYYETFIEAQEKPKPLRYGEHHRAAHTAMAAAWVVCPCRLGRADEVI
ncbi:hypothetical protein [Prevotella dentasini]